MPDLYSEDCQKTFENELASIEVRFEAWMIPAEAQHCCINRECVVLLSWIDLLGKIEVASETIRDRRTIRPNFAFQFLSADNAGTRPHQHRENAETSWVKTKRFALAFN